MNETGRKALTMLARLWIDNGGEAVQHEAERLTAEAGRIPEGEEQQARKLADDLRDLAEGRRRTWARVFRLTFSAGRFSRLILWLLPAITSGTGTITKAGRERRTAEAAGLRD